MLTFERDSKSGQHLIDERAGTRRDAEQESWNTGATDQENEFVFFAADSNERREKDADEILLEQDNERRDRTALSARSDATRLLAVEP